VQVLGQEDRALCCAESGNGQFSASSQRWGLVRRLGVCVEREHR
jgi:hypothetical protein